MDINNHYGITSIWDIVEMIEKYLDISNIETGLRHLHSKILIIMSQMLTSYLLVVINIMVPLVVKLPISTLI